MTHAWKMMQPETPTSLSGLNLKLREVAQPSAKSTRLTDAAQSFEAMMLNEMLKPLHFGAAVADGGEESEGGASDTIRGIADDALGKALAAKGGVGIARKIVSEITAEQDATKVSREGTKVR